MVQAIDMKHDWKSVQLWSHDIRMAMKAKRGRFPYFLKRIETQMLNQSLRTTDGANDK